ncbi:MAG: hypothetical protein RLN76_12380 [Phycisphaeraceae bacterium]
MTQAPTPSSLPTTLTAFLALTAVSSWVVVQQGMLPINTWASIEQLLILLTSGLWVAMIWIAGYGLGIEGARALDPQRTSPVDPLAASILGVGAILLGHWVNAATIGLATWAAWLLVGPLAALGLWHITQRIRSGALQTLNPHPLMAALGLPLGLLLAAAACPPGTLWRVEAYGYDVLSYHLQLPRDWQTIDALYGLDHNVYSFFPSLIEAGYSLLLTLSGSKNTMIEAASLLHASLAVAAALVIARIAGRRSKAVGWIAATAFLAMPWVLVTGSLAYNEMAVLAFAALALDRAVRPGRINADDGIVIGLLLGFATASKLTAGPMLAIPITAIALRRVFSESKTHKPRATFDLALTIVIAGTMVLAPYFIRNTVQTGNPVFPFATSVFGTGHWSADEVDRWDRAHLAGAKEGESWLGSLDRQWLRNTGYGAIGGWTAPIETRNIARFNQEGGFPLLGIVALAGLIIGLRSRDHRPLTFALMTMLLWQIFFWGATTHLQSRFLIPTLLPMVLLAALAVEAMLRGLKTVKPVFYAVSCLWLFLIYGVSTTTFWKQTLPIRPDGFERSFLAPPALLVGALEPGGADDHPINHLPPESKTYLVADASRLVYLDRSFVYESAFDRSRLGDWMRAANGDQQQLLTTLRGEGITHLWVHWSELDRLHGTYGYDPDVTRESLMSLMQGWFVIDDQGYAALVRIPPKPATDE